jgi:hypothetical protein
MGAWEIRRWPLEHNKIEHSRTQQEMAAGRCLGVRACAVRSAHRGPSARQAGWQGRWACASAPER